MPKNSAAAQAASARQAINLRTLQRIDPAILSILEWASYVVLYTYIGGKWAKEGIEGSLFVFERSSTPSYGFLILNRNGMNNFIRPITSTTELDVQDQFIHTSGEGMPEQEAVNTEAVHGLWFHAGAVEAERILGKMQELRTLSEEASTEPDFKPTRPEAGTGVLSMTDLLGKLSAGLASPQPLAKVPSTSGSTSSISPSSPHHSQPKSQSQAQNRIPPSISDPDAASTALKSLLGLPVVAKPSAESKEPDASGLLARGEDQSQATQPSPLDRLFLAGGASSSPGPITSVPTQQPQQTLATNPDMSATYRTPPPNHTQPHIHYPGPTLQQQAPHNPSTPLNGPHQSYATPPHMQHFPPSHAGFPPLSSGSPLPAMQPMLPVQQQYPGSPAHQPQYMGYPPLGNVTPGQGHPHPRPFPTHPQALLAQQHMYQQHPSSPTPNHPFQVTARPSANNNINRQVPPPQSTPVRSQSGQLLLSEQALAQSGPSGAPASLFPFMPAVLSTKSPIPKKTSLLEGISSGLAMANGSGIRTNTNHEGGMDLNKEAIRRILHQRLSAGDGKQEGSTTNHSNEVGNADGETFRELVREVWREDELALCELVRAAVLESR